MENVIVLQNGIFKCKICNLETKYKKNIIREKHLKSHIKKVKTKYICDCKKCNGRDWKYKSDFIIHFNRIEKRKNLVKSKSSELCQEGKCKKTASFNFIGKPKKME
jgi:hypothetical protein